MAALPRAGRPPARVLRAAALPHAVVLLPLLDRPVRDPAGGRPPYGQPPGGRARTVMTQRASHPATAGLPREPSGSMPRPAHHRRLAAAVRPGALGSHSQPPQRPWNGLTPTSTNARWFCHTLARTPKIRIAGQAARPQPSGGSHTRSPSACNTGSHRGGSRGCPTGAPPASRLDRGGGFAGCAPLTPFRSQGRHRPVSRRSFADCKPGPD